MQATEKQDEMTRELEEQSLALLRIARRTRDELEEYYPHMIEQEPSERDRERAESLKRARGHLTRALTITVSCYDELNARTKELSHRNTRRILPSPSNASIDYTEQTADHFARGRNLYKMLLICFIGSFVGVLLEMGWCLLQNGYTESRAGLVWGPFNLLYGAGAVALTYFLYPVRNHSPWLAFGGGFVIGSLLEYLCSLIQELLLGSTSWDYSAQPFNIGGRICLLYSVFWGILGVIWIKDLYPRLARLILRIPKRPGRVAVWVLTVFFVINALVSALAVDRWSERIEGIAPAGVVDRVLDERFPNERMERIYANMDFGEKSEES